MRNGERPSFSSRRNYGENPRLYPTFILPPVFPAHFFSAGVFIFDDWFTDAGPDLGKLVRHPESFYSGFYCKRVEAPPGMR